MCGKCWTCREVGPDSVSLLTLETGLKQSGFAAESEGWVLCVGCVRRFQEWARDTMAIQETHIHELKRAPSTFRES
jgi:hypothetical protein